MPGQPLPAMQRVNVLLTRPHASPPFAAAIVSHFCIAAAAKTLHDTPCRRSHPLVSPAHDAPSCSGVAHVVLVALQ